MGDSRTFYPDPPCGLANLEHQSQYATEHCVGVDIAVCLYACG